MHCNSKIGILSAHRGIGTFDLPSPLISNIANASFKSAISSSDKSVDMVLQCCRVCKCSRKEIEVRRLITDQLPRKELICGDDGASTGNWQRKKEQQLTLSTVTRIS